MNIEWREEKGVPPRVLLLRDEEEIRRVSLRIVSLQDLTSLSHHSGDDFGRELSLLEEKGAMRLALSTLARKACHSHQIHTLLKKHFVSEEISRKILSLFREKGYLDDDFWTKGRISSLRARGKSSREIAFRLKREGISHSALGNDEDVLARLISKKYPSLLEKNLSQKDQAKIFRALLRRGFSLQNIQKFLSNKSSFSYIDSEE
jgi:SOS response regulatory protein OraA/RecX